MPERKSFLLRIPQDLYNELELWAKDDLRSVNAQIEFALRRAVATLRKRSEKKDEPDPPGEA